MLFKLLSTFTACLLLFSAGAQTKQKLKTVNPGKALHKQLCVNETYYTAAQMKTMKPFADATMVKLVSYSKMLHGKSTDVIGSIINNGKVDTSHMTQTITLDTAEVKMLANILFNYGNKPLPPIARTACFLPSNAILFYDKTGKVTSCIEISFGCETMMKMPADLQVGANCSVKYDVLRSFFEKAGIHYFGDFD